MDIYNNQYTKTQAYSAAGATLLWTIGRDPASLSSSGLSVASVPLLAVGVTIQFGRAIQPQFVLNRDSQDANTMVKLIGPPQGTLSINALLTPDIGDMEAFLEALGRDCVSDDTALNIQITPFSRSCLAGKRSIWSLYGVIGQATNVNIAEQQGTVAATMGLTAQFTNMKCTTGDVSATAIAQQQAQS